MTRAEAFSTASGSVTIHRHSTTSYVIYGPYDPQKPDGTTTSANRGSRSDAVRYASGWKAYVACRLLGLSDEAALEVDLEIREGDLAMPWRDMVRNALARGQ